MKKPTKLQSRTMNSQRMAGVITIVILAVVGVRLLTVSHAQSPFAASESESGTLTPPATVQTDSSASGDSYVAFGSNNPDPSGQSVPVGNLPGWQQVFYDNFANESAPLGSFSNCSSATLICSGLPASLQTKWWDYPDGWLDTQKDCQYMPSQTMSIADGLMNMYIHTAANGTCMTAVPEAKIPNASKEGGQLYGRYSVRFRADAIPGYKTAFLLWPDSNTWPRDGEIDFPEGNLTGAMGAHMHYQNATLGGQQDNYSTATTYPGWHTATTEWTPNYVAFILDGVTIGTSTKNIPDTPMHWVLQTESELNTTTKPAASAAGNLQVDWVSIWSYNPATL